MSENAKSEFSASTGSARSGLIEKLLITIALIVGGWMLLDVYIAGPTPASVADTQNAGLPDPGSFANVLHKPGRWWFRDIPWDIEFVGASDTEKTVQRVDGIPVPGIEELLRQMGAALEEQGELKIWRVRKSSTYVRVETRRSEAGETLVGINLQWAASGDQRGIQLRPRGIAEKSHDAAVSAHLLPFSAEAQALCARILPNRQISLEFVQSDESVEDLFARWISAGWNGGVIPQYSVDKDSSTSLWIRAGEAVAAIHLSGNEAAGSKVWLLWQVNESVAQR
jgi:hypothetical protein